MKQEGLLWLDDNPTRPVADKDRARGTTLSAKVWTQAGCVLRSSQHGRRRPRRQSESFAFQERAAVSLLAQHECT